MPKSEVPRFKYTRRCTHTHVSGRRCEIRCSKKDRYGTAVLFCELHKEECAECRSMMTAFKPKNGWYETDD